MAQPLSEGHLYTFAMNVETGRLTHTQWTESAPSNVAVICLFQRCSAMTWPWSTAGQNLLIGKESKDQTLTQRAKVSSFLHQCMEKAKAKQHLLPHLFLFAAVEEGGVRNGVVEVRPQEIGSHSFGWLVGHFYSILENADRKLLRWVTG